MELTVDKLEAMVKEKAITLDNTLFILKKEFTERFGGKYEPAEVIHNLKTLHLETLEELTKEVDTVIKEQEELKDKIESLSNIVCHKLTEQKKRAGIDVDDDSSLIRTVLKLQNANLQVVRPADF